MKAKLFHGNVISFVEGEINTFLSKECSAKVEIKHVCMSQTPQDYVCVLILYEEKQEKKEVHANTVAR